MEPTLAVVQLQAPQPGASKVTLQTLAPKPEGCKSLFVGTQDLVSHGSEWEGQLTIFFQIWKLYFWMF